MQKTIIISVHTKAELIRILTALIFAGYTDLSTQTLWHSDHEYSVTLTGEDLEAAMELAEEQKLETVEIL